MLLVGDCFVMISLRIELDGNEVPASVDIVVSAGSQSTTPFLRVSAQIDRSLIASLPFAPFISSENVCSRIDYQLLL